MFLQNVPVYQTRWHHVLENCILKDGCYLPLCYLIILHCLSEIKLYHCYLICKTLVHSNNVHGGNSFPIFPDIVHQEVTQW